MLLNLIVYAVHATIVLIKNVLIILAEICPHIFYCSIVNYKNYNNHAERQSKLVKFI